jgi:hypothetical protein
MMKHALLAITAVSLYGSRTYANIGDTRQGSQDRYGAPVTTTGNMVNYHSKGWIISEWFNPAGYAEGIWYYKQHGKIERKETDAFYKVNLPAEMVGPDNWFEIDTDHPEIKYRVFITLDHAWRWETGDYKMGKYTYNYLMICTTRSFASIQTDRKANEEPTQQPAAADTDTLLPL